MHKHDVHTCDTTETNTNECLKHKIKEPLFNMTQVRYRGLNLRITGHKLEQGSGKYSYTVTMYRTDNTNRLFRRFSPFDFISEDELTVVKENSSKTPYPLYTE